MDPAAVRFAFRPLWQLSAAERAQVSLQKALTTAVYAGLNLWPLATTAALVRSQLLEDGVYPGAEAAFAEDAGTDAGATTEDIGIHAYPSNDFSPSQPRDPNGRWAAGAGGRAPAGLPIILAHMGEEEDPPSDLSEESEKQLQQQLKAVDPLRPVVGPSGRITISPPMPATSEGLASPSLPAIKVTGNNATQRGASYEQGIRDAYGSQREQATRVKGVGVPDDVVEDTAIEAKYTDNFATSLLNPDLDSGFPHTAVEDAIDQARRYATGLDGGVTYYTNSAELAAVYERLFHQNGITNFRFVIVPASR